jgi:3-oxoacyl-[acyl-carrier protein] reductase
MDLGLKGRTAAITGANKGIGLAVARELAREGVALHLCARNADTLARAAQTITTEAGVAVEIYPTDLSDRTARDAFASKISFVDIFVNCAGAIPGGGLDQVQRGHVARRMGPEAVRLCWPHAHRVC